MSTIKYTERRHYTAAAIARAITRAMSAEYGVRVDVANLREGHEDCGSGTLHFDLTISAMESSHSPTGRFVVTENRSTWANYGHPSGTEYRIEIDIAPDKVTLEEFPRTYHFYPASLRG